MPSTLAVLRAQQSLARFASRRLKRPVREAFVAAHLS
jgi:hypothetical protein